MSTTTIRLEDELRDRLAAAAKRADKTTHAFIVDAIAKTVEQAELDEAFDRLADARWGQLKVTGQSVPWEAARTYLEARAAGKQSPRPTARKPKR